MQVRGDRGTRRGARRSCPATWCKKGSAGHRIQFGTSACQAATADRLTLGLSLTSARASPHHVSTLQRPFVVLLEQQGADQPVACCLGGENTHDVGAALDCAIQALDRVGGVNIGVMPFGMSPTEKENTRFRDNVRPQTVATAATVSAHASCGIDHHHRQSVSRGGCGARDSFVQRSARRLAGLSGVRTSVRGRRGAWRHPASRRGFEHSALWRVGRWQSCNLEQLAHLAQATRQSGSFRVSCRNRRST